MRFPKLLGVLSLAIGLASAQPQGLADEVDTNGTVANTTLPDPSADDVAANGSVVNTTLPSNTTSWNQTQPGSDCSSSGNCGITGPLPPMGPPKASEPKYDANCGKSANCNIVNCPGIGDAIDFIIDKLSYMKPSAKYQKGEQIVCKYCALGNRKRGACAWVDGPDGSEMTISDAWTLLRGLRHDVPDCHMCGRNPTPDKGEMRVDYTTHIASHCTKDGPCPNY